MITLLKNMLILFVVLLLTQGCAERGAVSPANRIIHKAAPLDDSLSNEQKKVALAISPVKPIKEQEEKSKSQFTDTNNIAGVLVILIGLALIL